MNIDEWLSKKMPYTPFLFRRYFLPSSLERYGTDSGLFIKTFMVQDIERYATSAGWKEFTLSAPEIEPGAEAWVLETDRGPITLVYECEQLDYRLVALTRVIPGAR